MVVWSIHEKISKNTLLAFFLCYWTLYVWLYLTLINIYLDFTYVSLSTLMSALTNCKKIIGVLQNNRQNQQKLGQKSNAMAAQYYNNDCKVGIQHILKHCYYGLARFENLEYFSTKRKCEQPHSSGKWWKSCVKFDCYLGS